MYGYDRVFVLELDIKVSAQVSVQLIDSIHTIFADSRLIYIVSYTLSVLLHLIIKTVLGPKRPKDIFGGGVVNSTTTTSTG